MSLFYLPVERQVVIVFFQHIERDISLSSVSRFYKWKVSCQYIVTYLKLLSASLAAFKICSLSLVLRHFTSMYGFLLIYHAVQLMRLLKISVLKSFVSLEIPQQITLQIIAHLILSFSFRTLAKPELDILTMSSVSFTFSYISPTFCLLMLHSGLFLLKYLQVYKVLRCLIYT